MRLNSAGCDHRVMAKMIDFLKRKLELVVDRIYFWILKLHFQGIYKYRTKNRLILYYILLEMFSEKYENRDFNFRADISGGVVGTLLPDDFSTTSVSSEYDQIFVPYEAQQARRMPELQKYLLNHYQLTAFVKSYVDEDQSKKLIEKAKEIDGTIQPLNSKTYGKLRKNLYKEYRTIKKLYKQNIKLKRNQEKIFNRQIINLSITDVKTVFGVLSVLFFVNGYLYNRVFFGFFGIEVSKFFSISDYISTSIDKIYSIIIPLLISVVVNYFWWSSEYRESRRKMSKKRLAFEDAPFFLIIGTTFIGAIFSLFFDLPAKHILRGFVLFLLFQYLISKVSYLFKNQFFYHTVFSYIFLFFIFIIFGALDDGEMIQKYYAENNTKYTIELESSLKIDMQELYFLGANSKYSFFYNHKKEKSYAIPNKFIKKFSINQESTKGLLNSLKTLIQLLKKENNILIKKVISGVSP